MWQLKWSLHQTGSAKSLLHVVHVIPAAGWCWFPALSSNHGNHQAACQGDAETDWQMGSDDFYWGHESVKSIKSCCHCVIDEDKWWRWLVWWVCCDVHACWASLTPTNISDVIVIEKGEVNDRWGAGKKRQENLPQSKVLKSPTDKDCPYQASVAGGGKEALVRSQGEPVRGRLPGSMTLWNPLPALGRSCAGPHTLQFSLWSPGGQQPLISHLSSGLLWRKRPLKSRGELQLSRFIY